jgi:dipeptidyl-peptidase-4
MKNIKLFISAVVIAATTFNSIAQQKTISLEDIWKDGTFTSKYIAGLTSMKDGIHYTTQGTKGGDTYILRYEYATDSKPDTIVKQSKLLINGSALSIDGYQFNDDETKILIASAQEKIYRHSTRENYYIYTIKNKTLKALSSGEKQQYARFSPDGEKVAFVRGNNIFIKNLSDDKETQVTKDGQLNNIINGATDWVNEEEFSFSIAYFWSGDGKRIAYYRFDESKVREFSFNEFNDQLYPTEYKYKYPKAGEDNSIVTIHVYNVKDGSDKLMDIGKETNQYIPRIKWTLDNKSLSIVRINRHQNKLELLLADANSGDTKTIYTENSDTYIDIHEGDGDYVYFPDKEHFIIQSEKDGWNHLYLYDMEGKLVNQITKGNWDVMSFKGVDEKNKTLYYIASEATPTEKDIYSIKLDGSDKKKISTGKGVNYPDFSEGMKYYINRFSDANTPSVYTINSNDGRQLRMLEDNKVLRDKMKDFRMSTKEFFTFKISENVELNGWMIKPAPFNMSKKYPVLVVFYGGPGNNMVVNGFEGNNYFWYQHLAENGFIIMCVDNRGTMYRGAAFKKCTYKQLGKLEVADQIEVAKYAGSLPYVNKDHIGCFGWSFGGYLSSLCITKGWQYFHSAIAVAPVTNWRYYDNIYTERFMQLPQENAAGYDENSPINYVDRLRGKYLLIAGTADDNVHYQNTVEMTAALVKANKQFDLFAYPDKAHSLMGGNTRLHLYTKMTDFLKANL